MKQTPKVYEVISKVQKDLLKGIAKQTKNLQQGFMFRGIDDVYNALAPALTEHGLVILPEVKSREVVERTTKSGGALFYVTLKVAYKFICIEDGSCHTVVTFGEAMDSGDKATNKAMSAAYKYACFQAFSIPTESVEADAEIYAPLAESIPGQTTGEPISVDKVAKAYKFFKSEIDSDNDEPDYQKMQNAEKRLNNDEMIAVFNMFGDAKLGKRQYKNILADCLKVPLDHDGKPIREDAP